MRLTPEALRRVADLARLDLTDDEAARLAAQIGDILERVDRLEDAPDGPIDVEPGTAMADDAPRDPPARADLPGADPLAGELGGMAPAWAEGFFTVPRLSSHENVDPSGEGP